MRARRVRFTPSRERISPQRARAVATVEGVSRFRQSRAGRSVRQEFIQSAWQQQGGVCAICESDLSLSNAKLRDDKFSIGSPNPVVCVRCKRNHRKTLQQIESSPNYDSQQRMSTRMLT